MTNLERNLIDLELMIMEQVADWELDIGKVEAESSRFGEIENIDKEEKE